MDHPFCKTCPYWYDPGTDDEQGECRRHAPRTVATVTGADSEVFFPQTWDTQWCGEHPDFPAYLQSARTPDVVTISLGLKPLPSEMSAAADTD